VVNPVQAVQAINLDESKNAIFVNRSPLTKPVAHANQKAQMNRTHKYAKTIQTFMKKTEGKRKSLFLQAICADSGLCLTFGKEKNKLMEFFQFDKFTYATFPTKTLGQPSVNGFVKEIKYVREKYKAYAVLKSSKNANSDNLAYEYLVGKYLNEKSKRFPIFLDTYGLFVYKNSIERQDHLTRNELTSSLTPLDPTHIANVCSKTSTECILLQHFKNVRTLLQVKQSFHFFVLDSPYVFYHIYFALHHLRTEFTHYDLHMANVLLLQPGNGKYLEYHYHLPNETMVFRSKFLVKMIDYGRSFFPGAPDFYDKLMGESACKDDNELLQPFSFLNKDRAEDASNYYVNSYYKNETHDLRLFRGYGNGLYTLFKDSFRAIKNNLRVQSYIDLFTQVVYENEQYPHLSTYGAKEDLTHDDKIRNVSDLEKKLREWILQKETIDINMNQSEFKGKKKLGEFHIYSDGRDMEYKPA